MKKLRGKRIGAPVLGVVVRHTVVRRFCAEHGVQDHMSVLGDRCVECHKKGLLAQGLVKP